MWGNYATTPEPADPTLRRILQQADVSSLSTQYANGMEWRIAAQDILHRNGLSSDTHCHYSITVCAGKFLTYIQCEEGGIRDESYDDGATFISSEGWITTNPETPRLPSNFIWKDSPLPRPSKVFNPTSVLKSGTRSPDQATVACGSVYTGG